MASTYELASKSALGSSGDGALTSMARRTTRIGLQSSRDKKQSTLNRFVLSQKHDHKAPQSCSFSASLCFSDGNDGIGIAKHTAHFERYTS